jgi:hypothetical protein
MRNAYDTPHADGGVTNSGQLDVAEQEQPSLDDEGHNSVSREAQDADEASDPDTPMRQQSLISLVTSDFAMQVRSSSHSPSLMHRLAALMRICKLLCYR